MFRKSILASTLSLLLVPGSAWALGLGSIRTESALNQPFAADIELVGANPDELDAVKVVLASEAEFAKRGTDRQHFLTKLRFKPQISARGKPVVRVTSVEPVREPYMDFLVEVVWPQGRVIREFTVLLDPPVGNRRAPPAVERPVVASRAAPTSEAPAPAAAPREPVRSAAPPAVAPPTRSAPVSAPAPSGGAFPLSSGPIKPGTGLWRTARKLTPPGATVAQTAMALYRNNQDAFVQGDINRLRQGAVLQVPTSGELFALDAAKAETEFRSALAGKRVTAKPLTDVTAAAREDESRLKIAGAAKPGDRGKPGREPGPSGQGAQPGGDIEQELLLVRETGESTRQETDELRSRVRQLEAVLTEIREQLTVRNAELDRLRGSSGPATPGLTPGEQLPTIPDADKPPAEIATTAQPAEAAEPAEPAEPMRVPTTEPVAGEPTPPAATLAATEPAGTGMAGAQPQPEPTPAAGAGETPIAGAQTLPGGVRTEPDAAAAAAERLGQPVKPTTPEPEVETTASGLADLPLVGPILDKVPAPVLWSGLVAAPVLGLLAWLSVRRRRRIDESLSELGLPNSLNMHNESTSAMPPLSEIPDGYVDHELEDRGLPETGSGFSHLPGPDDGADEADAISEADIYIAYGRYRDAQGLLKQAIARSPHSVDLHYKLAETYVGAKDYGTLTALLNDMEAEGMDQAHPDQWSRFVGLTAGAQGPGEPQPATAATHPALGAAAIGVGLAAPQLGGDADAAQADQTQDDGRFDVYTELGFSGPVGEGESLALDASDSLITDQLHPQDLDLDFQGLDFGQLSALGTPDLSAIAPAPGMPSSEADVELTMADLVQATDGDLAALGVMPAATGMPRGPGARPVSQVESEPAFPPLTEPVSELTYEPDFDSVMALDTSPASPGPQTSPADEIDLSWAEPVPPPPLRGFGTGAETARFELGPMEQDPASSDLMSSQWQIDGGMWDEIGTKLDLGRAYVEMNDPDAAHAILAEVIEEGNADQQMEARSLLAQLKGH